MLILIEGPAGGGKSGVASALLEAGEVSVVSDFTRIWVAISGVERDPVTGLYPVRLASDPTLPIAQYLQPIVVRRGLQDGENVIVTTARPDQVERWRQLAADAGAPFSVRTVDPGEQVVRARLAGPDEILTPECLRAVRRWYG